MQPGYPLLPAQRQWRASPRICYFADLGHNNLTCAVEQRRFLLADGMVQREPSYRRRWGLLTSN